MRAHLMTSSRDLGCALEQCVRVASPAELEDLGRRLRDFAAIGSRRWLSLPWKAVRP